LHLFWCNHTFFFIFFLHNYLPACHFLLTQLHIVIMCHHDVFWVVYERVFYWGLVGELEWSFKYSEKPWYISIGVSNGVIKDISCEFIYFSSKFIKASLLLKPWVLLSCNYLHYLLMST
jgi:hypothetical protein